MLLCRCDRPIPDGQKQKIALFSNVPKDAVFTSQDVSTVYALPLHLHQQGLDDKLCELLNIWSRAPALEEWQRIVERVTQPAHEVTIGIVGKYVDLVESYKSLHEALIHGGIAHNCRVKQRYIDAEEVEQKGAAHFLSTSMRSWYRWLWQARGRRQDCRRALRPRAKAAVFWHLPRDADCGD
jgi:CTP synthase